MVDSLKEANTPHNTDESLPPNWNEFQDQEKGITYYYHTPNPELISTKYKPIRQINNTDNWYELQNLTTGTHYKHIRMSYEDETIQEFDHALFKRTDCLINLPDNWFFFINSKKVYFFHKSNVQKFTIYKPVDEFVLDVEGTHTYWQTGTPYPEPPKRNTTQERRLSDYNGTSTNAACNVAKRLGWT